MPWVVIFANAKEHKGLWCRDTPAYTGDRLLCRGSGWEHCQCCVYTPPDSGDEGILSTVYARLNSSLDTSSLRRIYQDYYTEEEFVQVARDGELPETKWVLGTNRCFLGVVAAERQAIIVSVIDNLVKGAAGQAVQNMNLMFGLPENTGLKQPGIYP